MQQMYQHVESTQEHFVDKEEVLAIIAKLTTDDESKEHDHVQLVEKLKKLVLLFEKNYIHLWCKLICYC